MTVFDWNSTSWDLRENPPRLALLPIGGIEQFGPHLPLATQNYILDIIARRVAGQFPDNVYLLPTMPLGTSSQHRGFAGTVSLSWRTLMDAVTDLVRSLLHVGVHRVAVIVGLGGTACTTVLPRENEIVKTAVRRLNYDNPDLDAIWVQPLTVAQPPLSALFDAPEDDVHAGEVVTSIMLHLYPDLVRDALIDNIPSEGTQHASAVPFESLCPQGVWGRPSMARAELGAQALTAAVDGTAAYIEETFAELARLKRYNP